MEPGPDCTSSHRQAGTNAIPKLRTRCDKGHLSLERCPLVLVNGDERSRGCRLTGDDRTSARYRRFLARRSLRAGARQADTHRLIRLVMWDVLVITGVGLVFGLVLSFAGGQLIASMLYQVSPDDPITLLIASSVLILSAVLAGYIPARRAARIDPMRCLRSE